MVILNKLMNMFSCSNINDDIPTTPRTPKCQVSPKIYSKWNAGFIDNNFKLTPKSLINTHSNNINLNT